jgi:hypothetical protein
MIEAEPQRQRFRADGRGEACGRLRLLIDAIDEIPQGQVIVQIGQSDVSFKQTHCTEISSLRPFSRTPTAGAWPRRQMRSCQQASTPSRETFPTPQRAARAETSDPSAAVVPPTRARTGRV